MATENTTLGRGDIYFAEYKPDGTLGGFRMLGNTPNFGISINSETLKHYSSARGVRTQDLEVPVQTDYEGSLTTDNVSYENLAMLLLGDKVSLAQAALTGETSTFEGVEPDYTYQLGATTAEPLGKRNVTNVTVTVGAATKAVDVDYTLDAERGLITILPTGTIASGATVEVEFDVTAHSVERTVSGMNAKRGALRFAAFNPAGERIDYYIGDARLIPNGEFQIKAEEWQELPFKIAIAAPAGRPAILANGQPYTP